VLVLVKKLAGSGSSEMGSSSSIMRPQELVEFRKLNTTTENIDIPARPESRTVTDKKGFLIFGLAILILIPFMIYTLVKSDLRRLGHDAYDDCGNLCGYYNKPIKDVPCSGKSYLDQSYSYEDRCVDSCPGGYTSFVGVCTPREKTRFRRSFYDDSDYESTNGIQDGMDASRHNWWKFLLSIGITIVLSVLTLVALRYVPGAVVWSIIVFSIVVLIGGTIGLWYQYSVLNNSDDIREVHSAQGLFIIAIVWTIIAFILVIVLIVLFKKIGLVVQLYKETAKALAALPLMVFIPVVITLLQIVVLIAFVTTTVWMMTGRELYKEGENTYRYEMNGVMIFAVIFNFVITCWTLRFFAGIQHMVISGSVATWYFAKNKQYLDSPICTSLCNAMKFHLGTVAFGSFILTLFAVVKAILRACFRNACCRCLTTVCCSNVEVILKFLSDNSFIETAIHGQSYFRSAKRATKLLMNNAASVIAISCVGDFVLTMIVFIVTVVATGISFALFMNADKGAWILPVVICLIVNVIIISITFSVFQITIDTLFICFCEDSVINDGMSRPYCMSRGLMEFVENSKKLYGNQNRQ
jgi:solute carrier family 44 protein 1 (choline transporter-like protein)